MSSLSGYAQANLLDMLDEIGEERVLSILSSFRVRATRM